MKNGHENPSQTLKIIRDGELSQKSADVLYIYTILQVGGVD